MPGWFITSKKVNNAAIRLICLPYAGGSATTYSKWHTMVPENVEVVAVQLPGRAERFAEEPYKHMGVLIDELLLQIMPLLDKPYMLIGHSMGSLIGFELIRRLTVINAELPKHFIASGCRAPHLPCKQQTFDLPKNQFLQELKKMNGTPEDVLTNEELVDIYIPLLRADFQLAETYRAITKVKLQCPVSIFSGVDDPDISGDDLKGWLQHFSSGGTIYKFKGDHFFIEQNPSLVLDKINQLIDEVQGELEQKATVYLI